MENVRTALSGYRLDAELKNVPVSFVNALRRILLAEIPTVVVSNVQILENTSSMTHEMIRHRTEMLPVNVRPEEVAVIRDTKIELRVSAIESEMEITSADFVTSGADRSNILLQDRDLGTPLVFVNLKPGQSLHIKANLMVQSTKASQVCVATFKNHIDPDVAKIDRDTFVAEAGDDPVAQREAGRIFDTFHIQRSFHRNKETGRPDWFDFTVESIGVIPTRDLVKKAVSILQDKVDELSKVPILREEDEFYRLEIPGETFTLGALVQELLYTSNQVEFASMTIGHPLVPTLVIRFSTKSPPESVLTAVQKEASALCENVLTSV